jgi:hypothetical protein
MDMIVDEKRGKKKESMLDYLARQGALKMLTEALDSEVTDFLWRYGTALGNSVSSRRNGRRGEISFAPSPARSGRAPAPLLTHRIFSRKTLSSRAS